jgi:hypothetical protein
MGASLTGDLPQPDNIGTIARNPATIHLFLRVSTPPNNSFRVGHTVAEPTELSVRSRVLGLLTDDIVVGIAKKIKYQKSKSKNTYQNAKMGLKGLRNPCTIKIVYVVTS